MFFLCNSLFLCILILTGPPLIPMLITQTGSFCIIIIILLEIIYYYKGVIIKVIIIKAILKSEFVPGIKNVFLTFSQLDT